MLEVFIYLCSCYLKTLELAQSMQVIPYRGLQCLSVYILEDINTVNPFNWYCSIFLFILTGFFLERCALFYYETCYAQIGDLEAMTSVKLPRRHRKLFRLTNKTLIQHYLGSMLWFFKAYKIYYALFKLTEKTH